MARDRHRAVLYERIAPGAKPRSLSVPRWWRRAERPPQVPLAENETPPADQNASPPAISVSRAADRVVVDLSTAAAYTAVALVVVAVVGAFVLGRRTAGMGVAGAEPSGAVGPAGTGPDATAGTTAAGNQPRGMATEAQPGLEELLTPPHARPAAPARAGSTGAKQPSDRRVQLWIESIVAKSARDRPAVDRDAASIQAFLRDQGVATVVLPVSNGVIILSEEQFPAGQEAAGERDAFRRRVEEIGRLYHRSGGRYAFKECFWKDVGTSDASP